MQLIRNRTIYDVAIVGSGAGGGMAAKVLTEAIRRARKPVNAKSVLDALNNLGSYDLGGFTITLGPNSHHGSKYVDLAMVTREGKLSSR